MIMATLAIMIGGAVLNAATFIGGNYLAKALSGDGGQAALDDGRQQTKHWPYTIKHTSSLTTTSPVHSKRMANYCSLARAPLPLDMQHFVFFKYIYIYIYIYIQACSKRSLFARGLLSSTKT